jgi:hypothetical protein
VLFLLRSYSKIADDDASSMIDLFFIGKLSMNKECFRSFRFYRIQRFLCGDSIRAVPCFLRILNFSTSMELSTDVTVMSL